MEGPPPLLNVEYWFRVIYGLVTNERGYSFDHLIVIATDVWQIVTYVAYVLTLVLFVLLVYVTIRIRDLAQEDDERFATIPPKEARKDVALSRWEHVEELMAGLQETDWRQAIIEADIMLDDILKNRGYEGAGLADRLKQLKASSMPSLDAVWDAHRTRNRIAHEGSAFTLEERTAHRTIQAYRSAFVELGVL